MTERLDRIEAQQEQNTANIADLITLSSNVLRAVDGLVSRIDESNQRFDVLRAEAIADRQETAQKFNDAIADSNQRFDVLRAEGIADREEHRTSFNNAITQMDTDRQRSDERYQTQLEVIQSLLMALGRTNRDVGEVETAVGQLGNRVDNLEAS
jgi:hypothetical protein